MKNRKLLVLMPVAMLGLLAACNEGTSSVIPGSSNQEVSSSLLSSSLEQSSSVLPKVEVNLRDSREAAFTAVIGEMEGSTFTSYEEDEDFPSLYEAVQYCLDEGEYGSYVYKKGGNQDLPLFVKVDRTDDYWFYYKDGSTPIGYYPWIQGDTEWYKDQNVTRILCHGGAGQMTYQPYTLKGHDGKTTQSWNRLPLMDAAVRYNPHAFTGIQDTTYTFKLSEAKIRPSYNETQKALPIVNLSTTDSYNWSNQGLVMDTETGYWYYFYGETQADLKDLVTDYDNVIMTSSWDEDAQEFTPNGDVKMTLNMIWDDQDEFTSNDCTIEVIENGATTFKKTFNYENNSMTMRGTHRAQIALDLVPADQDDEEFYMTPDYMCGAYFKNVIVTEGKGSVREGLTDEIYEGDLDMCCTAGETYDLLYAKGGYLNDSDTEVIIDNCSVIEYSDANADCDTWSISFDQRIPTTERPQEITAMEALIAAIPSGADTKSTEFKAAYKVWRDLPVEQQTLIAEIDGFDAIAKLLEE